MPTDGELPPPDPARADRCGDATLMMPIRKTTRAKNRAHYIATERRYNKQLRHAAIAAARPQDDISYFDHAPRADLDPPLF